MLTLLRIEAIQLINKINAFRENTQSLLSFVFKTLFLVYLIVTTQNLTNFLNEEIKLSQIPPVYFIIFFGLIEFSIRYFFQSLSDHHTRAYLLQNISKRTIVLYALIKSLFNYYNYPIIVVTLTLFGGLNLELKAIQVAIIITLLLFNHFLNILCKLLHIKYNVLVFGLYSVIVYLNTFLFGQAETSGQLTFLSGIFITVFGLTAVLIPFVFAAYKKALYTEFKHNRSIFFKDYFFNIELKDKVYNLIALELKLILRNNRLNQIILFSVLFYGYLFYVLLYDQSQTLWTKAFLILISLVFVASQYAQFLFSWECSYFDKMLTAGITTKTYILSKVFTINFLILVGFLLVSPALIVQPTIEDLSLLVTFLLFHLGISVPIYIYFGTFNSKKIELSKGIMFNYEGISVLHYLLTIVVMVFPLGLLYFGMQIMNFWGGIALINILSVTALVNRQWVYNHLTNQFLSRKHTLRNAFK